MTATPIILPKDATTATLSAAQILELINYRNYIECAIQILGPAPEPHDIKGELTAYPTP